MKRSVVFFVFLLAACHLARPQERYTILDLMMEAQESGTAFHQDNTGQTGSDVLPYDAIEGNAFLPRDFVRGRIILRDGQVFEGPLRFNMYTEEVEFQTEDGTVYKIIRPEKVEQIRVGRNTYVYVPEPGNPGHSISMELLHQNDYSLYARRTVEYEEAEPARPLQEPEPARFVRNDDQYYLFRTGEGYTEIRSRRSLYELFPGKKQKIKDFIKKNNLDLDEGNDLVRIIEEFSG